MGLAVPHEDAGLAAHDAVEAVHHIAVSGLVGAIDAGEVLRGGEPGGVRLEEELKAVVDGGGHVEAELALGEVHGSQGREIEAALKSEQGLAVTFG